MSEASSGVEYIPNLDHRYASMKNKAYPMGATNSTYGVSVIDVDNVTKVGISSKLFVTNEKENLELSGTITNKLKLTFKIQYDIHLLGPDYLEIKVATGLESDIELSLTSKIGSGDYEKNDKETVKDINEITIGRVIFPFGITGLSASAKITVPIDVELSGSLNAVAKVDLESGFSYNTISGGQQIDKKEFSSTADLTAKAKVSLGPKIAISVEFLEDNLKAEISANGGIAVEGATKKILAEVVTADSFHACDTCIEGKIECFAKVSAKATYNLLRVIKGTPWEVEYFDYRRPILDFYVSLMNDIDSVHQGNIKAGTGKCPNFKYKTSFDPQDMNKKTINNAVVSVKKTSSNKEVSSGKGYYIEHLYPGDYTASAYAQGIALDDKEFKVNKSAQLIVISEQTGNNPGDGGNLETSGKCGPNLTWELDVGMGVLTISGTGDMYDWELDEDSSRITPWNSNKDAIKKVVLEHGITNISVGSFKDCINLANVIIPDSVTSIDHVAFEYCINLKNINIPNGVTEIGVRAFGMSGLTSIKIPNGVTNIEDLTFLNCKELKSVTILDGVTGIGPSAFKNCIELRSVIIPESVTIIEESAFDGCVELENVIMLDGLESIGQGVFSGCTELKNISIPNSVTHIGDYAFAWSGIESIVLPNSITNLSEGLFSGCKNLKNISISDSVTTIGSGAFTFCDGLTRITIPDSVRTIEEQAFMWCKGLLSVKLSNNITSIENETFYGCPSLVSITIPDGVTGIGDRAFYWSDGLISITIPKSVKYIGDEALLYTGAYIYYKGIEDEWKEITIGDGHDWLIIHYNYNDIYLGESLLNQDILEEKNIEENIEEGNVEEKETVEEENIGGENVEEKFPNDVDEEPNEYVLEEARKINGFYGKIA